MIRGAGRSVMFEEDAEHPILPRAFEYEIVGLHLEREPIEEREPFLDLVLRRGAERRVLRFWSPVDIEIERGGPTMTSGLVIRDVRRHGLEKIGVRVDDFEGTQGAVRFSARAVEPLIEPTSLTDITFTENSPIDVAQLNALYRLVGWDRHNRRSDAETLEMLGASRYYVAAHAPRVGLVGFARVCGDPYVVQVLDVITHPDDRGRGIASHCMVGVVRHLERSRYVTVTATHGPGLEPFYARFGFELHPNGTRLWRPSPIGVR
jgi:GNAT superfamily N-acetyltransferase